MRESDHHSLQSFFTSQRESVIVAGLALLWLVHLTLYVVLVPAWQHYDEPTHFEYALLIRELGRLPTLEEQIPELRRAIAYSMRDAGFYRRQDIVLPEPKLDSASLNLGVNERHVPPSYYALVALTTLPVRHLAIESQLLVARFTSVALGMAFFLSAYGFIRLWSSDSTLRYWLLGLIALQPALADSFSSVNSDALANLVALLWLIACSLVLKQPTAWRFGLLVLAACLLFAVKRTLIPQLLLLPITLVLAFRLPWRKLVGGLTLLVALGALVLFSQPWSLASWIGSPQTLRSAYLRASDGSHSFRLGHEADGSPMLLYQDLPRLNIKNASGQIVTISAWMRSEFGQIESSAPVLEVNGQALRQTVQLGPAWQQVIWQTQLPADLKSLRVILYPPSAPNTIYYDSLALIVGDPSRLPPRDAPDSSYPQELLPQSSETSPNLLRNASAERFAPPVPELLAYVSGGLLDGVGMRDALATLSDPYWLWLVYPRQILLLFMSFWGTFGWGEVSLPIAWFGPLALLVFVALVGAGRFTWQAVGAHAIEGEGWKLKVWLLCLAAVAIAWGAALLRVHSQPFGGAMFWSFGRYAFVGMLPSLLVFIVGLGRLVPPSFRNSVLSAVLAFLLIMALVALFGTLIPHYSQL